MALLLGVCGGLVLRAKGLHLRQLVGGGMPPR